MNLAALLDLGVPGDHLRTELAKLNLSGFTVKISKSSKMGIHGTRVDVELRDEHHGSHNVHAHHEHRNLHDITDIITESPLSENVKKISLMIFTKIAVAEEKVHNTTVDEIHFHEVGAVDSIVDIVGAAVCLDWLNPSHIITLPVELGGGFVKCAHGTIPVPAPATLELLKGFPVKTGAVQFETTTPTGAAILAAMSKPAEKHTSFIADKIGYGIGHRDLDIPNVLRVILAEEISSTECVPQYVLECNIDDMNPEMYSYIIDKLLAHGAKDAWCTPIIMKKGRPAVTLSVLCDAESENIISEIIFRETTTFGLRRTDVSKKMLDRVERTVSTSVGDIRIKEGFLNGVKIKEKPEFEDCRRIADTKKIPLKDVYDIVHREGRE